MEGMEGGMKRGTERGKEEAIEDGAGCLGVRGGNGVEWRRAQRRINLQIT